MLIVLSECACVDDRAYCTGQVCVYARGHLDTQVGYQVTSHPRPPKIPHTRRHKATQRGEKGDYGNVSVGVG